MNVLQYPIILLICVLSFDLLDNVSVPFVVMTGLRTYYSPPFFYRFKILGLHNFFGVLCYWCSHCNFLFQSSMWKCSLNFAD